MKLRITNLFISYLLILLILSFPVLAAPPQTKLTRVDGVEQSMSEYIGQGNWVIANVWSPSCSFCLRELPQVEAFHAKHKDEGVIVIGITVDFPSFEYGKIDIINQFLAGHPLDYPIFLADMDLASEVIGKHLIGIPYTVIYHPSGKIHARWGGDISVGEIEELMQEKSGVTDDWTKF